MRASLTAAVTAFTLHLLPPAVSEVEAEQPGFLRRLAAGDVSGRELVNWADTVTAALMAFSASGGGGNVPALSPSSTTPTPSPATPTHTAPVSPNLGESHNVPIARSQSHCNSAGRNSVRSAVVRERTLTRDRYACVVTGLRDAPALEVAHIIPFSVRGEKAAVFWAFLAIFLGDQGAEALRGATLQLAGGSGSTVGEVANCMVLDVRVHRYFDGGIVEIVPVMGSGEWGLGREYDPSLVSSYDVFINYPGCAFLPLHRLVYSTSPQLPSVTLLTPGTRITLTTSDPATMPLPHPLLLQLHSLCGRIKRLRAAAGWPVLPYGNGSDDGVGWGEEDIKKWDDEEEADEEEGTNARREGESEWAVVVLGEKALWEKLVDGAVSPAASVEGWVADCGARAEAGTEAEGSTGYRGRKRILNTRMREELEEGDGGEVLERPRKVAVVMSEMGMRERERRRLVEERAKKGLMDFDEEF
ncbi:hypothetical protein DFP73DRAFT_589479 [Morchella snyderi]|nr:hypothetical protein DFP73DRAFT_589479 [Morchella snyderi]